MFREDRPDAVGPAGLLGGHLVPAGGFEVGYRLEIQDFNGLRDGGEVVPPEQVLDDYPIVPATRRWTEHTLDLRYGITEGVTLEVEVPWRVLDSGHLYAEGSSFSTENSGLSDVRVSGLVQIYARGGARAHLNLGVSIPTGAIDEIGATPLAPAGTTLPYGMQLGSGTVDLLPGGTVSIQNEQGSVGAQLRSRLHMGENDRGYRLGDRVVVTAWLSPRLNDFLSATFRVRYLDFDGVSGVDPEMDLFADPTADAAFQGGTVVEIPVGLDLLLPDGPFAGHRFGAEIAVPVHQDYEGIQPDRNYRVSVVWRKVF